MKYTQTKFNLSSLQKSTFFVNALGGAAKYFFLSRAKPAMAFIGIITLIKEVYTSDTRELQGQPIVNCLSLHEAMQRLSSTDSKYALTDLVTKINFASPHALPKPRSYSDKLIDLKQEVISND